MPPLACRLLQQNLVPFATFIVVLFGVPFASIRRRGGIGVQLGISLLVCFIYLIFMKVSEVFGYNGTFTRC